MATEAPEVELIGIGKRFPGVVANHDVDVTIRPGTVHAWARTEPASRR